MLGPEGYIVFLGAICGFTLVVAGVRFYILRKKLRRVSDWISDICFTLACIASCTNAFICMWKTVKEVEFRKANPGMEEQFITWAMFAPVYLKILFASATLYFCELWLMKAAFIAFYWSLFSRVQTKLRSLLIVSIVLTILLFGAAMITHLAWCQPISRNWTSDLIDYSNCASENSMEVLLTTSICNIITDFIVVLLPLTIIRRLSLGRLELYAVGFVFVIGALSISASLVRLSILHKVYTSNTVTLSAITQVEIWSITELNVAFLAFTLPSLRKVISERLGGLFSVMTGRGKSGRSGSSGGTNSTSHSTSKRVRGGTIDREIGKPIATVGGIPLQKRELRSPYVSVSEEELHRIQADGSRLSDYQSEYGRTEPLPPLGTKIYGTGVHAV